MTTLSPLKRYRATVSAVTAAVLLCPVAAAAADAANIGTSYIGTWGTDTEQCKLAQDAEGAPFVFAKDRYDQHEAHCTFKSVTPEGAAYKVAAECSVEGDTQPQDFTLTVSGNKLTWSDGTGALELIRCK